VTRQALLDRLSTALAAVQAERGGPLVVGVTGADASGKSHFAADLADRLRAEAKCQLIHVDDFHRPRAVRYAGPQSEAEKYLWQSIDLDQLAGEVLAPVHRYGELRRTMQHLHIEDDTYTVERAYDIDSGTIVLVEGVFLLRPPVREHLHHLVFLDVDEEALVARGSQRDRDLHGPGTERKFREKFLPAQRRVFAAHPPNEHADVIIDNNDWASPTVTKWTLPSCKP
jgi:uridine kinase